MGTGVPDPVSDHMDAQRAGAGSQMNNKRHFRWTRPDSPKSSHVAASSGPLFLSLPRLRGKMLESHTLMIHSTNSSTKSLAFLPGWRISQTRTLDLLDPHQATLSTTVLLLIRMPFHCSSSFLTFERALTLLGAGALRTSLRMIAQIACRNSLERLTSCPRARGLASQPSLKQLHLGHSISSAFLLIVVRTWGLLKTLANLVATRYEAGTRRRLPGDSLLILAKKLLEDQPYKALRCGDDRDQYTREINLLRVLASYGIMRDGAVWAALVNASTPVHRELSHASPNAALLPRRNPKSHHARRFGLLQPRQRLGYWTGTLSVPCCCMTFAFAGPSTVWRIARRLATPVSSPRRKALHMSYANYYRLELVSRSPPTDIIYN
ncbi:uncharacterized protein MYCFIDRAFT_171968 [Pseudocercospora fijiensis CIRAD86]|uniref:Uncharacterized protein n=1 Tax=Pseudocercospora fijiensis (strain CIRAD86) TaxID=383855 RepID=M3BA91_PSEFD|nr:uncharacterized protein MYCFIDRAFT_171968 [Pseudocercospora fijiensis CIRAD86]EME86173.1 hypothetical protein MYCFIDRAFT_171968 [Pseudocercospora fijiensis CIRAD86]